MRRLAPGKAVCERERETGVAVDRGAELLTLRKKRAPHFGYFDIH